MPGNCPMRQSYRETEYMRLSHKFRFERLHSNDKTFFFATFRAVHAGVRLSGRAPQAHGAQRAGHDVGAVPAAGKLN